MCWKPSCHSLSKEPRCAAISCQGRRQCGGRASWRANLAICSQAWLGPTPAPGGPAARPLQAPHLSRRRGFFRGTQHLLQVKPQVARRQLLGGSLPLVPSKALSLKSHKIGQAHFLCWAVFPSFCPRERGRERAAQPPGREKVWGEAHLSRGHLPSWPGMNAEWRP